MRYKSIFLASCLAAMIIAVPSGLRADTENAIPDPEKVQDIANHLSTLDEHAAGVTRDAETVRSLAQDHHTNWQSHAYYLNNLRDDVNGMGELLAELETAPGKSRECDAAPVQGDRC